MALESGGVGEAAVADFFSDEPADGGLTQEDDDDKGEACGGESAKMKLIENAKKAICIVVEEPLAEMI